MGAVAGALHTRAIDGHNGSGRSPATPWRKAASTRAGSSSPKTRRQGWWEGGP